MNMSINEGARQESTFLASFLPSFARVRTPLTKSGEKERLLAVYNHPESGKFLRLESGILGFGIPNLAEKKNPEFCCR